MDKALRSILELDGQIVTVARSIKVLSNLSWGLTVAESFIQQWNSGNKVLPEISYPDFDYSKEKASLTEIMQQCDVEHPLGMYVYRTAESYLLAAEMIERVGTPGFTEYSIRLYGHPSDNIVSCDLSYLDAAKSYLEVTDRVEDSCAVLPQDTCILPQTVVNELQEQANAMFADHAVKVVLDPNLASKAAAGARRVRIRSCTCFSPLDVPQLTQHECFVHTLTALNGREQKYLKSMGLGAPRTTRTQEGLALFAELVMGVIDVNRMRRIALRVTAVQAALDGADFIEIFELFLNAGENNFEAFQSAARVFRGGKATGSVAFTKDAAYLAGLTDVHTFLRKAIHDGKLNYPVYLCAGRLAIGDVIELEEYFINEIITHPTYKPQWIENRPCLTAFLLYSTFLNRVHLKDIQLPDFCSPAIER